jgi:hypothetical protein
MNLKTLTIQDRAELLARFSDIAFPDTQTFSMERTHFSTGTSFSPEALNKFHDLITLFIGGRVMARWYRTKEPPTIIRVEIKIAVG